jgi:hypothetical protein
VKTAPRGPRIEPVPIIALVGTERDVRVVHGAVGALRPRPAFYASWFGKAVPGYSRSWWVPQ